MIVNVFLLVCDPVGIRTQDPQLRRLLLYPAELRNQIKSGWFATRFVALEGFEPSQAEPESDVLPLHHKAV